MLSTTFVMLKSALAVLPLLSLFQTNVAVVAQQVYNLDTNYTGANFFDGFDFFTGPDPSNGFVNYVPYDEAKGLGLVSVANNGTVTMKVDAKTKIPVTGAGRFSTRISTKKTWTHGLFISDIAHMPGGICGTWPAHWTLGPNWPQNGEIDIIEGVNSQTNNLFSLHTAYTQTPTCKIADTIFGKIETHYCDTQPGNNTGCSISDNIPSSYGAGFNAVGGGVFAMEWTSDHINMYFFQRRNIPGDIVAGAPDPRGWQQGAQAAFLLSCSIDANFANHQILFDTNFCGDFGNPLWSTDRTCKTLAPNCTAYVAANPAAFANAFWSINYVAVYQLGDPKPRSTTSSTRSSSRPLPPSTNAAPSSTAAPGSNGSTPAPPVVGVETPEGGSEAPDSGYATSDSGSSATISGYALSDSGSAATVLGSTPTSPSGPWFFDQILPIVNDLAGVEDGAVVEDGGKAESDQYYTSILSTAYVDICSCAAETLTTKTFTSTVTRCSCEASDAPEPTIDVYTTTAYCSSCGAGGVRSTYTLTLPCTIPTPTLGDIYTPAAEIEQTQPTEQAEAVEQAASTEHAEQAESTELAEQAEPPVHTEQAESIEQVEAAQQTQPSIHVSTVTIVPLATIPGKDSPAGSVAPEAISTKPSNAYATVSTGAGNSLVSTYLLELEAMGALLFIVVVYVL